MSTNVRGVATGAPSAHRGYLVKLTIISLWVVCSRLRHRRHLGRAVVHEDALQMDALQEALVVSALLFPGAAGGALIGGRLADKLGRRGTLIACAITFLVGALGCALAPTVAIMIIARSVLGLGVGAAAVTCPLYLAEMAPTHLRGRMVHHQRTDDRHRPDARLRDQRRPRRAHPRPVGLARDARCRHYSGPCPADRNAGTAESPRFLAIKERWDESRKILELSRSADEADREFAEIVRGTKEAQREKGQAWRDLKNNRWMRRLLYVGCGLAIVQQATGINTVNYYAPTILESSGLGVSAALVATSRRRHERPSRPSWASGCSGSSGARRC